MILDNRYEDEIHQLLDENNILKYRIQQLEIELHSLQNNVYEYMTTISSLKRAVDMLSKEVMGNE